MLRVNNRLWLISDTHFGHRNIIKFQQRPESHEIIMLSEWAKRVGENDQILHLGDVWMKASNWRWAMIISRLPGQKFMIRGNHDGAGDDWYERAGFEIVPPFVHRKSDEMAVAFSHVPISDRMFEPREMPFVPAEVLAGETFHVNIHGHTHGNPHHPTEGSPLAGKTYINVCVEKTDLKPVQLGSIFSID